MMISRITDFFKTGIWQIRLKDPPSVQALLIRYLRIILLALRGFARDNCQKTASVLTYYSLLNLVPVVAV
ncbi:MAG: YihY/virulence factor BrkB family protein, partial [Thermodesulfobacteriota bacterium]